MLQVGLKYYVMVHAYHHFVVEIAEVLGPMRAKFGRRERVQSCRRGWTEFFRDGPKDDTEFTIWPEGGVATFFDVSPWHHDFPSDARRKARSQ